MSDQRDELLSSCTALGKDIDFKTMHSILFYQIFTAILLKVFS